MNITFMPTSIYFRDIQQGRLFKVWDANEEKYMIFLKTDTVNIDEDTGINSVELASGTTWWFDEDTQVTPTAGTLTVGTTEHETWQEG